MHTYATRRGDTGVTIHVNEDWSGDALVVVENPGIRFVRDKLPAMNLVHGVVPPPDVLVAALTWQEWCWAISLAARQFTFHEMRSAIEAVGGP